MPELRGNRSVRCSKPLEPLWFQPAFTLGYIYLLGFAIVCQYLRSLRYIYSGYPWIYHTPHYLSFGMDWIELLHITRLRNEILYIHDRHYVHVGPCHAVVGRATKRQSKTTTARFITFASITTIRHFTEGPSGILWFALFFSALY